jgi:hypothetical protein
MRSTNEGDVDAADFQLTIGRKVRTFALADTIVNLLIEPVLGLRKFRLVRGCRRAEPAK